MSHPLGSKSRRARGSSLLAIGMLGTAAMAANTPAELRSKQVVSDWLAQVFVQHQVAAAFEHGVSRTFIQHGRVRTGAGSNAYRNILTASVRSDAAPMFTIDRLVADEDVVTAYTSRGVDVYRVRDGRIDSHWDASSLGGLAAVQAAFAPPAAGAPDAVAAGGSGASTSVASQGASVPPPSAGEQANERLVSDWMMGVFGRAEVAPAFERDISRDFKQHGHRNQGVGYDAFEAYLAARKLNPARPFRIFDAVGSDDRVTMCTSIGVDLYRVHAGRITDHWDASAEF